MNRRQWLARGAAVPAALPWLAAGSAAHARPQPPAGGGPLKITDVRTTLTAPAGIRLVVVKVLTSEPGLYGLGCATFTQRARAVQTAVDQYPKPFLVGKDPLAIEDTWQSAFVSSYWRNGPVLGNALSGVDMALWDVLGKRAGMPVYQLLGGKCRKAVDTYRHATGQTAEEVAAAARALIEQGQRHVRVQVGVPGLSTYGAVAPNPKGGSTESAANDRPQVWEPRAYARAVPRLFEHLRKHLGDEVELLHDVHERVPPPLAIQLAKDVEPFKPYFLEDPFSPEDVGYFEKLRPQTSTPIAMGELFNNPNEWLGLVSGRLIDFIRIHISQIGGADDGPEGGRPVRVLRGPDLSFPHDAGQSDWNLFPPNGDCPCPANRPPPSPSRLTASSRRVPARTGGMARGVSRGRRTTTSPCDGTGCVCTHRRGLRTPSVQPAHSVYATAHSEYVSVGPQPEGRREVGPGLRALWR